MSPSLPDRRSGRPSPGGAGGPAPGGTGGPAASGPDQSWKWVFVLLAVAVIAVLIIPPLLSKPAVKQIPYKTYIEQYVEGHKVKSAAVNNNTGVITGELKLGNQKYTVNGPDPSLDNDVATMRKDIGSVTFNTPTESTLGQWLPTILILVAFVAIFFWISRRAQGQMSGIMSIGRSRARLYTTERPRTTFADVAGYQGVKIEISEVVDFLKSPTGSATSGPRSPRASCSSARRERARRCWPGP